MEGVNDMLKSLSSDIRERLFPVLDLNDIMWDEVLDRKCMGSPDDEEEARERDEADQSMLMPAHQYHNSCNSIMYVKSANT